MIGEMKKDKLVKVWVSPDLKKRFELACGPTKESAIGRLLILHWLGLADKERREIIDNTQDEPDQRKADRDAPRKAAITHVRSDRSTAHSEQSKPKGQRQTRP
jgi:predicted Fe-S protein YdhL (DUF1289 family)